MLQPVFGELDQLTDIVTFPGEDLFALVSAGPTVLDSTQLNAGFEDALFVVQDVEGIWDGHELTLDITWTWGGAQLWLRITSAALPSF